MWKRTTYRVGYDCDQPSLGDLLKEWGLEIVDEIHDIRPSDRKEIEEIFPGQVMTEEEKKNLCDATREEFRNEFSEDQLEDFVQMTLRTTIEPFVQRKIDYRPMGTIAVKCRIPIDGLALTSEIISGRMMLSLKKDPKMTAQTIQTVEIDIRETPVVNFSGFYIDVDQIDGLDAIVSRDQVVAPTTVDELLERQKLFEDFKKVVTEVREDLVGLVRVRQTNTFILRVSVNRMNEVEGEEREDSFHLRWIKNIYITEPGTIIYKDHEYKTRVFSFPDSITKLTYEIFEKNIIMD